MANCIWIQYLDETESYNFVFSTGDEMQVFPIIGEDEDATYQAVMNIGQGMRAFAGGNMQPLEDAITNGVDLDVWEGSSVDEFIQETFGQAQQLAFGEEMGNIIFDVAEEGEGAVDLFTAMAESAEAGEALVVALVAL